MPRRAQPRWTRAPRAARPPAQTPARAPARARRLGGRVPPQLVLVSLEGRDHLPEAEQVGLLTLLPQPPPPLPARRSCPASPQPRAPPPRGALEKGSGIAILSLAKRRRGTRTTMDGKRINDERTRICHLLDAHTRTVPPPLAPAPARPPKGRREFDKREALARATLPPVPCVDWT